MKEGNNTDIYNIKKTNITHLCQIKERACNYITFLSNSRSLCLGYEIENVNKEGTLVCNGLATKKGISMLLYSFEEKCWIPIDQIIDNTEGEGIMIDLAKYGYDSTKDYILLIYFPVFYKVKDFTVGSIEGAKFEVVDLDKQGNIAYIGAENTKGEGIIANSFSFSNIVARRTKYKVCNLSFVYESIEQQIFPIERLNDYDLIVIELDSLKTMSLLSNKNEEICEFLKMYSGIFIVWTSSSEVGGSELLDLFINNTKLYNNTYYFPLYDDDFFVDNCMFEQNGNINDYGNVVLANKIIQIESKYHGKRRI